MDTSPEYIKMCEMAVEVQGKHVRGNFDELFFHKDCVKMLPINGFGQEQILERHPEYNYKSDIRPKEWNDYCIWLPRQDQLQEMMDGYSPECADSLLWKLEDFYQWCRADMTATKFKSFEQLWLVYVMYRNHHKSWNGEDWIDAKA